MEDFFFEGVTWFSGETEGCQSMSNHPLNTWGGGGEYKIDRYGDQVNFIVT